MNNYDQHKISSQEHNGALTHEQLPQPPQQQALIQEFTQPQSLQQQEQRHEDQLFSQIVHFIQKQDAGPMNFFNGEYYVVNREDFDYTRNQSQQECDKQEFIEQLKGQKIAGPIIIHEEYYYVINNEIYFNYLESYDVLEKQRLQQLQQFIKQQVNGPVKYHNVVGEYFIIKKEELEYYFADFAVNFQSHGKHEFIKQLTQRKVAGPTNINGDYYYVLSKELYDEYLKCHNHHKFIKQLRDHQIAGPKKYSNLNGDYYVISEEIYKKYLGTLNNDSRNSRNGDNNTNYKEIIKKLEEDLNKSKRSQKMINDQNQKLKDHINELSKVHNGLKEEASKYQSALGDATSFHLGNQDSNSTSQLSEDIRNLHLRLEKFCGLKKGVEVKELEAKELLKKYNCSITGSIRQNKNLISGALQRNVIETIIVKTEEYFNHKENDKDNGNDDEQGDKGQQQSLEMKIVKTTEQLLKMTSLFSTIRTGSDEVSKAIPTKLRQQIYGALGNRGFSNTVINEKDSEEHSLVVKLRKDIVDLMNRYRTFKVQEKLAENEKMINEIVRQIVNIFFFRLKVQEPVAKWKWFSKNAEIDTMTMEGSWDKSELEDLYVDVCTFPLIYFFSTDGEEKTIFHAQIITNDVS